MKWEDLCKKFPTGFRATIILGVVRWPDYNVVIRVSDFSGFPDLHMETALSARSIDLSSIDTIPFEIETMIGTLLREREQGPPFRYSSR